MITIEQLKDVKERTDALRRYLRHRREENSSRRRTIKDTSSGILGRPETGGSSNEVGKGSAEVD